MVNRIATHYQNQNTLRNIQQANQGISLTTYQITSGLKSQYLSEIAPDANQILTLKDVQAKTDSYLGNIASAKNYLQSTQSALQSMTDLLSDASNVATLGRNENSPATRQALAPKAESVAESFYALFKSQYNGRYLFSGSDASAAPLSTTAAATAFPGSPVPTTWYQGDSQLPSIITGAGTTLQYGVLGNDSAFAKMKAGLEALWYGLQNNSVTEIDNAITTLNGAKEDLSALLGNVGGQVNTADLVEQRHTTQQQFLTTQRDDLEKVDISNALTQFSQQQATLQASMMIITRVNQVSLLDYLR